MNTKILVSISIFCFIFLFFPAQSLKATTYEVREGASPDTTAPVISDFQLSPSTSPVSGVVTISANVLDLTTANQITSGIASVQFKLDIANLGDPLTTPNPSSTIYSGKWDTSGVSNGSHTLLVVAKDIAGNTATSTTISITVSNTTPPPPPPPPPPPAGGGGIPPPPPPQPGGGVGGGGGFSLLGSFTPLVPQLPVSTSSPSLPASSQPSTTYLSYPSLTTPLSLGSTGSQVTLLQRILVLENLLTPAQVTGTFDKQTLSALITFQVRNTITTANSSAAGLVGPTTRAVMNRLLQSGRYLSLGVPTKTSTSATLTAEQRALLIENLKKQIAEILKLIVLLMEKLKAIRGR